MKGFKVSAALPADLQQAYDYFRRGGQQAGERFLDRYARTLEEIQRHPEVQRVRASGWRQRAIPRSSYAIFYRELPDFWFVGAVISTVRDPDVVQAQLLLREIGGEGVAGAP